MALRLRAMSPAGAPAFVLLGAAATMLPSTGAARGPSPRPMPLAPHDRRRERRGEAERRKRMPRMRRSRRRALLPVDRQGARSARCPTRAAARRSAQEREGTGVVIGDDGLILTIGYLIVEADEVSLVDQQGRTLPARVVGYDHATGLGPRARRRAARRRRRCRSAIRRSSPSAIR